MSPIAVCTVCTPWFERLSAQIKTVEAPTTLNSGP